MKTSKRLISTKNMTFSDKIAAMLEGDDTEWLTDLQPTSNSEHRVINMLDTSQ